MHRRDKWLVFDLGSEQTPCAISLLGVVDSFGGAPLYALYMGSVRSRLRTRTRTNCHVHTILTKLAVT